MSSLRRHPESHLVGRISWLRAAVPRGAKARRTTSDKPGEIETKDTSGGTK
jgi:hypothetical protein